MRLLTSLVLLLLFSSGNVHSAQPEGFRFWLNDFRRQAEQRGITAQVLDLAFSDVRYLPGVIEADRRQPEFKKTLQEYLAGAVNAKRVERGRELLVKHRRQLQRIAQKYRVQPHYLVALWGIETSYGRNTGKIPIVSALATLSFDGRRGAYFQQELLNVLTILQSGQLEKSQLYGSWAGALGNLQFMPSTFLGYAVDGDQDDRIDLWKTPADYFSSAANYLSRSGWVWRQKWGRKVKLPANLDQDLIGLESTAPLSTWQSRGVRRDNGRNLPRASFDAALVAPNPESGEGYLVYDNYRVLMTWNRAHSFAIAVGTLADRIVAPP